ncbi:MAG: radical SAM protein [Planctomycetaceae bacterium]|jgi:radical SAM protein with 4Fe4S-binding SPASM domain|nr:radical SAM protein [Planctomycetaceae bacterium]
MVFDNFGRLRILVICQTNNDADKYKGFEMSNVGTLQAIRAKTKDLFDFNVQLTEQQYKNSVSNSEEIEHGVIYLKSCPKRLVFELTNVCNLRCKMCGRNDADFSATIFNTEWIDKFAGILNTIEEVTLMGWGEPTMHPEFIKILERLNQYSVRKYFCTNGQKLSELQLFNAIFDCKVDVMAVSLDGAVAVTNDSIRGKSFYNVINSLKNIVQERIKRSTKIPYINFVFTAMRSNFREIPALIRLTGELGIEEVKVVFLTAFNNEMETEILYGRMDEVKQIFEESIKVASELNIRIKLPHVQGEDPSGSRSHKPCYTAWRDLFIGSDGFVRPCMSTPIKFFHIDECKDFEEIWNHPSYQYFRTIINNTENEPDSCKHCYQSSFANWNRNHAFIQTGLTFSPEWKKIFPINRN